MKVAAILIGVLIPLSVSGAGILINEIAWMGTVPKAGESTQAAANNEWLELYNPTSAAVSLDGWKITSSDNMPDFLLSGSIPAGGYWLLERGSDDVVVSIAADILYSFKNNALSNLGEHLFLKEASGNVVDEINASSGWPAGDNTTKDTMQRSGAGWVTAKASPRAANQNQGSPLETQPQPPSIPATQTSNMPPPSFRVYAGEDKTVIAGSKTDFLGYAENKTGEELESARFLWNFGDGETAEGRSVGHIFNVPGNYMIGLHVSSGTYAVSDYLKVNVIPNKIKILRVVEGEAGFMELANPDDVDLDIGEWIMDDGGGQNFIIPSQTKISGRSNTAFSNRTTGLFRYTAASANLRYPNGIVAATWHETADVKRSVPLSVQEAVTTLPATAQENIAEKKEEASLPSESAAITESARPTNFLFFLLALVVSIFAAGAFIVIKSKVLG